MRVIPLLANRLQDHLRHLVQLAEHLVVPEPQHPESLRLQPLGAQPVITNLLPVMTSVYLDDQSLLEAGEVHYIAAQGCLPPELVTCELSAP